MGYILLNNLRFQACHGVLPQEQTVGALFTVSLRLKVDFTEAALEDDLRGTVNYAEVYEAVKEEMGVTSRLLENVAYRISGRILKEFPQVEEVEIRLLKQNPPMGADCDSAGVEGTFTRKRSAAQT